MPAKKNPSFDELVKKSKFGPDSQLIVNVIKVEFERIRSEFQDMRGEFLEVLNARNGEIDELKGEVSSLKQKVKELSGLLDENDAYERRDTVIVRGDGIPEVKRGENCGQLVSELLKQELKVQIPASEISTVHRLGSRPNNQMPDKRNFIIKFCRRDFKREVIYASKKVKSRKVIVHENLTPARRTIFQSLRRMKQQHPELVKGVSTYEGKIYAYTPNGSSQPNARDIRHAVNDIESLSKFCTEYVKKPLELFLANFRP